MAKNAMKETVLHFPVLGLDKARGYLEQRPGTCAAAQNVRAFEPATNRARGGSRPGFNKYFPVQAVGTFPIQDINHLVGTDQVSPQGTVGQFVYALAAGSGVDLGKGSDGSNLLAGLNPIAGYQFENSCWDQSGNFYFAIRNTTTGAVNVYGYTSTGTNLWAVTGLTSSTVAGRKVAGLAYVAGNVYVGLAFTSGSVAVVHRINAVTGALTSNFLTTTTAQFFFSTTAVQAMAGCSTLLGIEAFNSVSGAPVFIIVDTVSGLVKTNKTQASLFPALGNTATNTRSSVCSDNVSTFYAICGVSANQVRSISTGGIGNWGTPLGITGTLQDICYDKQNGRLLIVRNSSAALMALKITDGSLLASSATPGSISSWQNIDTDGLGNITLWRNSVASTDTMGLNSAFVPVWGPSTKANTLHDGASVNKDVPPPPTVSGTSRQVRGLVVSNGTLKRFTSAGPTALTSGGAAFSPTIPNVFSAQLGLNMFYADGSTYQYYQGQTDSLIPWTLTTGNGTLPVDSKGQRCRLICTWNGRLVLSGLLNDPQNWFMSAQLNAFNFNYNPTTTSVTQAVAGSNGRVASMTDTVTSLVPYADDTLIMGGTHTLWMMQGDPMNGGSLVRISGELGMAWGKAWTLDPYNQLYFFGSKCGIFKLTPGALPVRISQQIERDIEQLDFSNSIIRLEWDIQAQGLHVWITPYTGGATTHYFFEDRTQAWFPVIYGNTLHSPFATHAYDGDNPNDRIIMVGGQDGYVRSLSSLATTDDGTTIASSVLIGPLLTKDEDDILLHNLQATLATSAANVTYNVYVGTSAEAAITSSPVATGTWGPGRNAVSYVRQSGFAVYVQISATGAWAIERLCAIYEPLGMVRRRGVRV